MALAPFSHPTMPLVHGAGPVRRWRLLAVVALCVLVVGWLFGLTATARGWLTMGLTVLLVALLRAHRGNGARWLARVLCEYAVVGVLAVLLATPLGPQPQPTHRQPGRATASAATELCPPIVQGVAGALCHKVDRLWQQAKARAKAAQTPTTTTRPHRR